MVAQSPLRIRIYKNQNWGRQGKNFSDWVSEESPRISVFRQVRLSLIRKQPVLLQTSRWSGIDAFLDSIRKSLSSSELGTQPAFIQPNFKGESLAEDWMRLATIFRNLLPEKDRPSSETLRVLFNRSGFRTELKNIFTTLGNQPKPKSAIVLCKVERWPLSIIEDIQLAWHEAFHSTKTENIVPFLITGAISGGHFNKLIWLNDFSVPEAQKLLQSRTEPSPFLQQAIVRSGGIPDLVFGVMNIADEPTPEKLHSQWQPIGREIHHVIDIVAAQRKMLHRLQDLCNSEVEHGFIPLDTQLIEAGLVCSYYASRRLSVRLRAPYIRELLR